MNHRTYRNSLRIFAASLLCCIILNLTAFYAECEQLRSDFLRLHVIAASDSASDQQLKLKVRDAVLSAGAELFNGSVTAQEAENKILPDLAKLTEAAEQVLSDNNCTAPVRITVQKEFFSARQYHDITLPAGLYEAVKVVIGEGKGQNWWCVMFPPMCLPAAGEITEDFFTDAETEILKKPTKYRAKLKIVEIIQKYTR